jgi:hypothetical protein
MINAELTDSRSLLFLLFFRLLVSGAASPSAMTWHKDGKQLQDKHPKML